MFDPEFVVGLGKEAAESLTNAAPKMSDASEKCASEALSAMRGNNVTAAIGAPPDEIIKSMSSDSLATMPAPERSAFLGELLKFHEAMPGPHTVRPIFTPDGESIMPQMTIPYPTDRVAGIPMTSGVYGHMLMHDQFSGIGRLPNAEVEGKLQQIARGIQPQKLDGTREI